MPEKVFVTSFFTPSGPSGSSGGSLSALLAVGLRSRVVILQLGFAEEEETMVEPCQAQTIKEINHDGRVQCIAWDYRTDLCAHLLRFATGGAKNVSVFTLSEAGEQVRVMQAGHTDYVNDIAFQPHSGEDGGGEQIVASGSDDCSLLVHDSQTGRKIHAVTFASPCMSVRWHPGEGSKLLAAEKSGVMHVFNMVSFNVSDMFFSPAEKWVV
jgi:nuclear pore complex protein Nup37